MSEQKKSSIRWEMGAAALFVLGMSPFAALQGDVKAAVALLGAGLVLGMIYLAYRWHDLGWVVDARGERQKVIGRDRFGTMTGSTSHAQRRQEELEAKEQRRPILIGTFFAIISGSAVAYALFRQSPFVALLGAGLAVACLPTFVVQGVKELIYLSGFQHMYGAKVLDPEPKHPGIEVVQNQMVHGGTTLAKPAESHDLLNPKGT